MEIQRFFRKGFLPLASGLMLLGLLQSAPAQALPAGCASEALGDPAMVVDTPANALCNEAQIEAGDTTCYTKNVAKATRAFYPDDPSNVYHSYLSDT